MAFWTSRWFLWPFFTLVFTVFYAFAFSAILGLRDNYRRYAQKAELQWTEPGRRTRRGIPGWPWFVLLAFLTSAAVVEMIILR